jgi:sulfatase modifying factor 1
MRRRVLSALVMLAVPRIGWANELPGEKSLVNSIGMRLVRIEPGSFLMGSPTGGDFDERPVHRVAMSRPFFLGTTEVTNVQYERFDPQHKRLRGKLGFSKEDDEAVILVSWHEAVRFCRWLSRKEDRPYRLPTEAEWEYACRAGTTTPYHTGETLPREFHKNARVSWYPSNRGDESEVVPLHVGRTSANAWGLYDMHGNVEEWCYDWYGPYAEEDQTDPVGRADGDFRVTRGGSHSTTLPYLRSANRLGTLPEDRSWLIGFRVVLGDMPDTKPLPVPPPPLNRQHVTQKTPPDLTQGPDPTKPYFKGPRTYVKVPPGSEGPMFSRHNHDPAVVECPNGDLLAVWYSCRSEAGRELCILASRLRHGREEWEPASPFWDAPDRNDHAPAMWADGHGTIYHFNGLSAAATWGNLAIIMRVSTDSGATWSKARLIMPEHGVRHQPVESVFQTREGWIVLPCDAVPGGSGGTAVILSRDGGRAPTEGWSWTDPGEGKPQPRFRDGETGAWIAGIHAGVTQLKDGRLMAFGRGDSIGGRMPRSISRDLGRAPTGTEAKLWSRWSWTYSPSPFPPIGGGQRLILTRLREGPILLASFARKITITDASGARRPVSGLFAALSTDEGHSWQVKRLLSDDGPPRQIDGGGNTGKFTMSYRSAEPGGYLSVCQTPDGVIHLISSKQHYAFNLAWLNTPAPAAPSSGGP